MTTTDTVPRAADATASPVAVPVRASLGPLGTTRQARGRADLHAADRQAPCIPAVTCRNVQLGALGVKGSPVQILSSRRPERAVPFDGVTARSAF